MKQEHLSKLGIFKKLLFTHITIVVSVIVVFIALFSISYGYLMNKKNIASFEAVNRQVSKNIDTFFYGFIRLSETSYYTPDVRYALETGEEVKKTPYYTITAAREMCIRMFLSNQQAESIYITFDKMGISYSRGYNGPNNFVYDIENEDWFSDVYQLNGQPKILPLHRKVKDDESSSMVLSVARYVVKPFTNEPLGLLVVNIKPESLKDLIDGTNQMAGAATCIVDENNIVAYSDVDNLMGENLEELGLISPVGAKKVTTVSYPNKDYLVVSTATQNTGLRVVSIIPTDKLNMEAKKLILTCVIIGVALILLSIVVAFGISYNITKPILKLNQAMLNVEKGNFDVVVPSSGSDEIAHLTNSFNYMIAHIKTLIQTIVESGEEKQRAEVLALQAQINPHFMYNSLNTIKLMSQMQGTTSITQALSSFIELLKYCSRDANSEVDCEEEIRFVSHYIALMQLRYFNRFRYIEEISAEVYQSKMLKFVLQPFIENTIFHGFADDTRTDYLLTLTAAEQENSLVFIVSDNGGGISDETIIDSINLNQTGAMNSIGIANVISRIKLHYGEAYGVQITSGKDGTTVKIVLPRL